MTQIVSSTREINMRQLPFSDLTPYMIQCEFENSQTRIRNLMDENSFKNAIKENRFLNETQGDDNVQCDYHDFESFKSLNRNGNSCLNIYSLNISSLPKHAGELVCFISALETKFDIIILTEIGASNIPLYDNLFKDFVFRYVLPVGNPKGGVGIYFSTDIMSLKLKDDWILKKLCDCCLCEYESLVYNFEFLQHHFTLVCAYRHPSGKKDHFTNSLEKTLDKINNKNTVILAGDMNIDLIKFDNHYHFEYATNLFSRGFLPSITIPTRITAHTATCIDHIFVQVPPQNNFECVSGVLLSDISDHLPCFLSIKTNSHVINKDTRPNVRLYGDKECDIFKTKMQQFDWDALYTDDVGWYSAFISVTQNIFYASFPVVKLSRKRSKDKPWITKGIKISIQRSHKMYRNSLKSSSPQISEKYHKYITLLRKIIKNAQTLYHREIFDSKTLSVKKLWQHLNDMINTKRKSGPTNIEKILYNGSLYTDNHDISNKMNEHFCTIGNRLKSKLPQRNEDDFKKYLPPAILNSFCLREVLFEEVWKEINALKTKKATGPDGIGNKIVKHCREIFAYNLTKIFNKSIKDGIYPDELKVARVIALHKKGHKHDPDNYRPISILSCFNKIFERLICKQLVAFLEKYKLIFRFQFGFREDHSAVICLTEITDHIRGLLDNGNYVLGLFVDFTKAFDTVDHEILLYKMRHYGIRGHANNFFRSYLSNRKQYTFINGVKSQEKTVDCGVPQGSVLGPILFLIYVNDLACAVGENKCRLFADDTGIFTHNKNFNQLIAESKQLYSKLFDWCIASKLTINLKKTHFMLFYNKNKPVPNDFNHINVGEFRINRVEETKYLGLTIDEKLYWTNHIKELGKSLVKFFGIFKNIRHYANNKLRRNIYFTFVYSKISYGIQVYGASADTNLKKIQTLQNKILKFLFKLDPDMSTKDLHYKIRILNIKDSYEVNLLNFVNKCVNGKCPDFLKGYFPYNQNVYNIREHHLKMAKYRTVTGSHCSKKMGPKLWNRLNDCCIGSSSRLSFKKHVTKCYISKYAPQV